VPFGPWTNSKPGCVSGASFARSKPRTDRNDWRSSFAAAAPIRPQHPVNNTRSSIFWITVAKGPKVYKCQRPLTEFGKSRTADTGDGERAEGGRRGEAQEDRRCR
jgi:hypothetical protein